MASPFRAFRKHQKWLIAILGLLAMVSFVFLPIIMDRMGSTTIRNPVVVKTKKYGNLTEREVSIMRDQRLQVIHFIDRLRQSIVENKGNPERTQTFLLAIGPASEDAVVHTWLLANEATRLGLMVDNTAINAFLRELTGGSVETFELKNILDKEIRLSQRRLFELLGHELLALRFQEMFQVSLPAMPPGQRWDYFTRLKRQAAIGVVAVEVKKFAEEIPDPGDEKLQAFFEQYKDNFPNPTSPEPGFHQPHKIAVRYFKANAEEFQKQSVTDDEVYASYKEIFGELPVAAPPSKAETPAAPKDSGPSEPQSKSPEKAPPEKPSEKAPAGKPPAEKPPAEKAPAEKNPDEKAPTEGAKEKPEAKPNSPDSSSAQSRSPFRFTSFPQKDASEGEGKAKETKPEGPAAGPEMVPPEQAPVKAPKPEEPAPKPEKPAPKAEEPATKPEEPAPKPPEPSAPGAEPQPPAAEPPAAPPVASPPAGPKLSMPQTREAMLASPIGKMLRARLAAEKMQAVLTKLEEKMQDYRKDRNRYETEKTRNLRTEPPAELDFAALARQYPGVSDGRTPLVSPFEALDYDIGHSFVEGSQQNPFVQDAFHENWQAYLPQVSVDRLGNRYLFWKVDDEAAVVPKFEEVRDKVLEAWKMVEARKLALAEAERLAEKARNAGVPLVEALAHEKGVEVKEAAPFSWLTIGSVPMMAQPAPPPRLSEVEHVDMPGEKFMQTVFSLKVGEIGAAMNQPETVAYVIRVREIQPTDNALWAQFEIDPFNLYASAATDDVRQMIYAFRQELVKDAGLEWVRPAEQAGGQ